MSANEEEIGNNKNSLKSNLAIIDNTGSLNQFLSNHLNTLSINHKIVSDYEDTSVDYKNDIDNIFKDVKTIVSDVSSSESQVKKITEETNGKKQQKLKLMIQAAQHLKDLENDLKEANEMLADLKKIGSSEEVIKKVEGNIQELKVMITEITNKTTILEGLEQSFQVIDNSNADIKKGIEEFSKRSDNKTCFGTPEQARISYKNELINMQGNMLGLQSSVNKILNSAKEAFNSICVTIASFSNFLGSSEKKRGALKEELKIIKQNALDAKDTNQLQ